MPDIRLTDAEREKLVKLWHEWATGDTLDATMAPEDVDSESAQLVALITAALSAVPRLALASPMVAELVALVHYGATHAQADDEKVGILRRLAALTGEEATG